MNEAVVIKQSPRFSWELVSALNGQKQTAWQVSDETWKLNKNGPIRMTLWNRLNRFIKMAAQYLKFIRDLDGNFRNPIK